MKSLMKMVLGALCLVLGANAFPGPSVTINKVETAAAACLFELSETTPKGSS